mmetsp:Transcript_15263/g.47430  ORF Transcript_15263/g.47430 Transcript_15263/m.47430 type:complete len:244 (+) Transcript_15263:363-1094(+)
MHVRVHGARRADQALARDGLGVDAAHQPRVHAVHHVRVARLAQPHDAPFLDAHVRLEDTRPVEHHHVGDDCVQHLGVAAAHRNAHALAQRLAAAESALVARRRAAHLAQVALHLDAQRGVAQPHRVAQRGAVHGGVVGAAHGQLKGRTRLDGAARHRRLGRVAEAALQRALQRRGGVVRRQRAVCQAVAAAAHAPATNVHQHDRLLLAGLKAHRRPGGDMQPPPEGLRAVKRQPRVGLEEVIV